MTVAALVIAIVALGVSLAALLVQFLGHRRGRRHLVIGGEVNVGRDDDFWVSINNDGAWGETITEVGVRVGAEAFPWKVNAQADDVTVATNDTKHIRIPRAFLREKWPGVLSPHAIVYARTASGKTLCGPLGPQALMTIWESVVEDTRREAGL